MAYVEEISINTWRNLTNKVRAGLCTPIIGAGASYPTLPKGADLSDYLASRFDFPLKGHETELSRVAEYFAIDSDITILRSEIVSLFQSKGYPDFDDPLEPHNLLADLNLPVYVTTNYDDFMYEALRRKGREPVRDFPRWTERLSKDFPITAHKPTREQPLVYHFHGHCGEPESMVITEGNYLDFLIRLGQDPTLIPAFLQAMLVRNTLLFMGYAIKDWNFRVLLRSMLGAIRVDSQSLSFAVQLPPEAEWTEAQKRQAYEHLEQFLQKTCGMLKLTVCWSPINSFSAALRDYWSKTGTPPAPRPAAQPTLDHV